MMNDEEILKQYRLSGDQALLEELIRRHFDRIYRFVASMTGNCGEVDDLVQDVLLSVIRNVNQFRGESAFSTWVYRIASNRGRRHFETLPRYQTADWAEIEAVPARESTTAETGELKKRIDLAIDALSPALRAAILLTCVEGLSPEEAAAVENCSPANIHWRVHKARKILLSELGLH